MAHSHHLNNFRDCMLLNSIQGQNRKKNNQSYFCFFYSNRDLSSNRLRAIKKGMLQGLQEIDNL
jgi:hypothetical protein